MGVPRLLDIKDVLNGDEDSIVTYIAKLYWSLAKADKAMRRLESIFIEDRPGVSSKMANLRANLEKSPLMPFAFIGSPKRGPASSYSPSPKEEETSQFQDKEELSVVPEAEKKQEKKLEHLTKERGSLLSFE